MRQGEGTVTERWHRGHLLPAKDTTGYSCTLMVARGAVGSTVVWGAPGRSHTVITDDGLRVQKGARVSGSGFSFRINTSLAVINQKISFMSNLVCTV